MRLREMGWDALVIWECETKDRDQARVRIKEFLENR